MFVAAEVTSCSSPDVALDNLSTKVYEADVCSGDVPIEAKTSLKLYKWLKNKGDVGVGLHHCFNARLFTIPDLIYVITAGAVPIFENEGATKVVAARMFVNQR